MVGKPDGEHPEQDNGQREDFRDQGPRFSLPGVPDWDPGKRVEYRVPPWFRRAVLAVVFLALSFALTSAYGLSAIAEALRERNALERRVERLEQRGINWQPETRYQPTRPETK